MKPIIFTTEEIQAILAGRKTSFRLPMKPFEFFEKEWGLDREPYFQNGEWRLDIQTAVDDFKTITIVLKYQPGDVLYVRETWSIQECEKCRAGIPALGGDCQCEYVYRSNYGKTEDDSFPPSMFMWRSPATMPREAARLFLRITGVRAERLWEIDRIDISAEGCGYVYYDGLPCTPEEHFEYLWDSRYEKKGLGWDTNPWILAHDFEVW